jgi:glycosyltransferase involved in cell wall biosynthesis
LPHEVPQFIVHRSSFIVSSTIHRTEEGNALMTASSPAISVVMSVFNGDKYLRDAVDSILTQKFSDFEFIIVDDGSTDGSPQILQDYARKDSRIKLLSGPNKGLTRSLNQGLAEARGQFIARMDSDDISLPQRIEKQVEYLRDHPQTVLVGSSVEFIDPDGYPINTKPGMLLTHEQIDADLLKKGWPVVHPAVMIRRDALTKIGGYSEKYVTNQDHDLFLRLAEIGQLANLPEVLLKYRQHFASVSLSKSTQQGDTVEAILHETYQRRGMTIPANLLHSRPKSLSPLDHRRNWAWAALAAGNVRTARRHALVILRESPLSPMSWRITYCAIRGH